MPGGGVSNGPNWRTPNESLAETGPGLPDDAVLDGELAPGELGAGSEAREQALKRNGWTKPPDGSSQPADEG